MPDSRDNTVYCTGARQYWESEFSESSVPNLFSMEHIKLLGESLETETLALKLVAFGMALGMILRGIAATMDVVA